MAFKKSYHGVYKDNMQQATRSGTLREIRNLATLISSPGIGVGRTVCIATVERGTPYHDTFTGECYEKGRKRKASGRVSPSSALLGGARRRRRRRR
jgi:hypothetical protein